jgi:UDP-N-acetylmuramoylalanine-D-glutamate ligase
VVVVGQVAPEILRSLDGYSGKISTGAKNMSEIVAQAKAMTEAGDIVLLSPGAASFGVFKNEFDRGDQFVNLVKKLK